MIYTELNTMSELLAKKQKIEEIVNRHNNEVINLIATEDSKKFFIANALYITFYAPPECPCDTPLTLVKVLVIGQEWAQEFAHNIYESDHLIYRIESFTKEV